MRTVAALWLLATTAMAWAAPAEGATRTVCPSLCSSTTIQAAINASTSGDVVQVQSTYTGAGEVFPIQTLVVPSNITIQGQKDGSGNPISIIGVTGGANVDGIIVVSPGSTLKDLKIVPNTGNMINRVIAAGALPPTLHLNGLTIDNVVIDFTPGFNARNGMDLIADNVTIQNSTLKGINENGIFVDGDTYVIQNNTLNGFNGGSVRSLLAIGFGADLKTPSRAVCSGFPTNYTIQNNTISGFVDGIQWCTGRDTQVKNNVIQDITQSGILTSGSVRTTIEGNVLTQNTVGGVQGIGMSANNFQACDSNFVRNNTITGRPVRDLMRGIAVQSCTTSQVVGNILSNFGDFDGSIFYTMSPGQPTASIIQGNTVSNGNASGIVYFGSDPGGTGVDGTVIQYNVVFDHRRNGVIVQGMKSAFNVVAYNVVRSNNQGGFPATHGYSLQNLRNTVIDRNESLDTRGAGVGFFLANAQNLQGTCNTGAGNGGGLLAQVGVMPGFANPVIFCRLAQFPRHDFDGDGKADIAVFRGTTGEWIIQPSGSPGAPPQVIAWGCPVTIVAVCDDVVAPADYDGDGKDDVAVYRFSTGVWFIRKSSDLQVMTVAWGANILGDVPVPGRYTPMGGVDIAVYRTSTGEWYIRRSTDLSLRVVGFGAPSFGDIPVPGDYDGDGLTDLAVYRKSIGVWFIFFSSTSTVLEIAFGSPFLGDLPVPANYTESTGMKRTDIAVYRSLTGEWFIRRATDLGLTVILWGAPTLGDIPVPGNYTDPNKTDLAIYRLSDGTWIIRRSSDGAPVSVPWGAPSLLDMPLTSR